MNQRFFELSTKGKTYINVFLEFLQIMISWIKSMMQFKGYLFRLFASPMSTQQPASSLTEAAVLRNNILPSVETIRTLSNVTAIEQQLIVANPSVDMLHSHLAFLFN